MDIYVARQPIFDTKKRVIGYELLHRSGLSSNNYQGGDGTEASLAVIRSAFLFLGERILPRPRQAFINFTKDLLISGIARMLPPDCTVIEVLEDVVADDQLVDACRELKEAGYTIALDDYTMDNEDRSRLIDLADIVKVDLTKVGEAESIAIARKFADGNKQLVAEGVETNDEFEAALSKGFSFFQGYFFSKPVIVPGRDIPANKLNYVRILEELNKPELDFRALEQVVKHDTSLCYTLLKYINSAYFGLKDKINSILQAMVFLGETQVRKWACLVLFTFLGVDRPPEVVVRSLTRGRMCELLAKDMNMAGRESELFLMGMFSLLDALIGRPLKDILEGMNLGRQVQAALLGEESDYAGLYQLVLSYESGDWEGLSESINSTAVDPERVLEAYVAAVEWADQMTGIGAAAQN
jgi:c-di-GMP-related signal transduction protein